MNENAVTPIDPFKNFNCFSLNDKEFSDLICCIFHNESIRPVGDFYGRYNRVTPSPETREKGKDSMLYLNDTLIGVIQCKLIKKNTTLGDFLNEFVKFILYGIEDNLFEELKRFDYYFAAPYGFTNDVHDFTRYDNRLILNLEEIIKKIFLKYSTLKHVFRDSPISELETQVYSVIQKINITPLNNVQIDSWLNKEHNKYLARNNSKYSEFTDEPIEQILNDFEIASNYVANCSNSIDNIPNSHILRDEVNQLYEKINTPFQVDKKNANIFLLVGGAGCGKSGIMRDLYYKLQQLGTPVLAIKSDKYENLISLTSLQEQLNLQDSIIKQINTLCFKFDKIVILIDQIDAITLFQSTKNNNWNTYRSLIASLEKKHQVRIIISIRNVDLETDVELKSLNQYNKIIVNPLNEFDVEYLLKQREVDYSTLPKILKTLLTNVNALNIFCKIDRGNVNVNKLTTLNALYKELWRQKITHCPKLFKLFENRCSKLVLNICKELSQQGSLLISDQAFIDDYSDELKYLKSCGILLNHNDEIEFFHSKFFEYSLAKSFIETGKTLTEYIIENKQFLEIRPIVRTVLELQRDTNKNNFYQSCISILTDHHITFHIKLLVINILASQTSVTQKEKEIVENIIFTEKLLKTYFLETVIGLEWLLFLNKKNVFNYLIESGQHNLCYWILRRHLPEERNFILSFLKNNIIEFDNKKGFIINHLIHLKIWDNDLAYQLFDENFHSLENDTYGFYHIMEDAALYKPDWVIKEFDSALREKLSTSNDSLDISINFEHEQRNLLKVLFEVAPEQSFNYILNLLEELIALRTYKCENTNFERDYAFGIWRDDDKDNRSLIGMFSDFIRKQAESNSIIFRSFLETHSQSPSITILELIINGFSSNPKFYKNEFFSFLIFFNNKKGFVVDEKIHYKIRKLITALYSEFDGSQKEQINEIILSVKLYYENEVFIYQDKKRHHLKNSGETKYKYICAIPEEETNKNIFLKKKKQELERKFGKVKDEKPRNYRFGVVGAPLSQNAYNNMSFNDWEKTFQIFHDYEQKDPFSLKGSLTEHSRAFKETVKQKSEIFFQFVEKIINIPSINREYIIEGLNGLIEANYSPQEVKRIFKQAMWNFRQRNVILYATWIIRYFIKNNIIDTEILKFLSYHARTHIDPEHSVNEDTSINQNDKLVHGINSVRGSIAEKLNYCYDVKECENIIFDTVEILANDKIDDVRLVVVQQLYLLKYLNSDKALSIFQSIIKSNIQNKYILKAALRTANDFSFEYYEQVEFYFRIVKDIEDIQVEAAKCLFYCWLDDNESAFLLLDSILNEYYKAKVGIIPIVIEYLVNNDKETLNERALSMCIKYLSENDIEIAEEFNSGILRLKSEHFNIVLPFLKEYSCSNVVKLKHGYFYHYLSQCCDKFPSDCLNLIKDFDQFSQKEEYYDKDLLQIILTCYYRFGEDEMDKKLDSIKLFDKLLMEDQFRISTFNTLELFD